MIVWLSLQKLRHSLVRRGEVGGLVRQCSLACDTQHSSDRYIATLACLLGETLADCSGVAKSNKISASSKSSSHCTSVKTDGKRGTYYTLHAAVIIALLLLRNISAHSRNAARASATARKYHATERAISCQPHQLTHHKAVVLD